MSKADETLADVRSWLCGNLSDGDAGMVCGMLSVVSRHINELEAENAKLQELASELYEDQCDACDRWKYRDRMRELGIEEDE